MDTNAFFFLLHWTFDIQALKFIDASLMGDVNTPPYSKNSKWHYLQRKTQVPVGKHNNWQHASPHHEVTIDVKQTPIRPIIIIMHPLKISH